jgi:hypothetical protein
VRAIGALGALLFAYLAVIPAALVGATLDPGCETACGSGTFTTAYLVIVAAACALVLLAAAVTLAAYAIRPSPAAIGRIARALGISALLVGLLLFSEVLLAYPGPGLAIAGFSALVGVSLTLARRPPAGRRRGPA